MSLLSSNEKEVQKFEAVEVKRLGQWQGQALTWRDLHHGGRVPAVPLVAVGTLNKDWRVGEALGEHLSTDVVEAHALPNVAPRLLHHWVAVDIGQQTQAEPLTVARVWGGGQGLYDAARITGALSHFL